MRRLLVPLRALAAPALVAAALLLPPDTRAADPQPYEVTLKPTGVGAIDAAVKDSSSLVSLREQAPVGGFALVQRAREDQARFAAALGGLGYYGAKVSVTVDGLALDDPAVVGRVEAAPAAPPLPVVVAIDPGPMFKLGQVRIDGAVPADDAAKLALSSGADAVAGDIIAAQGRLLAALRDSGHPMARVDLPPAMLHPDRHTVDVVFVASAGPKAEIGAISFAGLDTMRESFMRERLRLHPGETYSPAAIEAARQDLLAVGMFSSVRIIPAQALGPGNTLPVMVDVTERKLHAVDLGAAYSTDLGASVSVGWRHRNLFGGAEQLNLTASANMGGTATTKPGYSFLAQFIKPDFLTRNQSLEVSLNALKQSLQAYDQKAVIEKVTLLRRLTPHWTVSLGLLGEQEQIVQEGVTNNYNLVGIPAMLRYDSSNSLLDPTRGIRASLTVTPMQSLTGSRNGTFVIAQLSGSTYLDLAGDGRSVIALRGLVGQASGVGVFGLPPDQRFYAGGSGTVRGYRFQSVGPQFASGNPTGGNAIAAGTVEYRQRILDSYGFAAFIDAGQVSTDGKPFSGNWAAGAGIGARYYTSIGPIRLDVAVPLNKLPGGDSFELYIGIGQAF